MSTDQGTENGATDVDASTMTQEERIRAGLEPNPTVPKLVIELQNPAGGTDRGEFLAFAKVNNWALFRNAEAAKSGDQTAQMASVYNLAITSIPPGPSREAFEAFMMDHGQDEQMEDKLTEALFALWRGETRLPLVPIPSDSSTSTGESEPTSTDDSSEPESAPEYRVTGGEIISIHAKSEDDALGWPTNFETPTSTENGSSTPASILAPF